MQEDKKIKSSSEKRHNMAIQEILTESFLQALYSFKNQAPEDSADELFEEKDKTTQNEYFELLKTIKCYESVFEEDVQNQKIFWVKAGHVKIPFSNRSCENGEFRGGILKATFEEAKNKNISVYQCLESHTRNLPISPIIKGYFFGLQQILVAKFKNYSNKAIANNLRVYISDFLEWLKKEIISILEETNNVEDFMSRVQSFAEIHQEIKKANQFIEIINNEFSNNPQKISNLLTTVLNENLLLPRQSTVMTCFVEERHPTCSAIKINMSPSKVKNAIDNCPTRIKPGTIEFDRMLYEFFEGSLENNQFIFMMPLIIKTKMLIELERGYHIKIKGNVCNIKNLIVKVNGKINIQNSSEKIAFFFNDAGIQNPHVMAYLICAMSQGGIEEKSANLSHMSTKEILNEESDFLIGGRNASVILEIQEDNKSTLSFVKKGELVLAGNKTLQSSENPKARIFHSFEINYTDDGKITDILPQKNFLFCPIVGDTRDILKEAIVLADPDGSIEYALNLDDPQHEETVSEFVDYLKKEVSHEKPFQSVPVKIISFNDYLNGVWDLPKSGNSDKKTYGEISLGYANSSSSGLDGQITRMFNDFPTPYSIMYGMTSIIKAELEELLIEKNINKNNLDFSDILHDEEFLAIWKKVFIQVVFPWILDPFTGKLKSNIKTLLEKKYGDTYIHWTNNFSEGKLVENFICSLFVGPLVYTSYCNAPTNYATVLDGFLYSVVNHSAQDSIPYTGGTFDQQLLRKFIGTSLIQDEIKKWSDKYKPFMDCKSPDKILRVVDAFDIEVEGQYDKLWRNFHHSLAELQSTEQVFTEKAFKMVKILGEIISHISEYGLNDRERSLLFQLLPHCEVFVSVSLFNGIRLPEVKVGEKVDPQKLLSIFGELYIKIDSNDSSDFFAFSYGCTWISENYVELDFLLKKICKKDLNDFLISSTQRLPKLPLFSKTWIKLLEKSDQAGCENALIMARILDIKFNKICVAMNKIVYSASENKLTQEILFKEQESQLHILEACNSRAQNTLSDDTGVWDEYEEETTSSESDESSGAYIWEIEEDEGIKKAPKIKLIFNGAQDKLSKSYCLFNLLKKEYPEDVGSNFLMIDVRDMSKFEVSLLTAAEKTNDLFSESFSEYLKRVLDTKKQCLSSSSSFFQLSDTIKPSKESEADLLICSLFVNCPLHLKIFDELFSVIKERSNSINFANSDGGDIKISLFIFNALFKELFDDYTGELKPEIIKVLEEKFSRYKFCTLHLGAEHFKLKLFESYAIHIIVQLDSQIDGQKNQDGLLFKKVQSYFSALSGKPKIKYLIQNWSESNKQKSAITSIKCVNGCVKSFSFEEKDFGVNMLLEIVIGFMKGGFSIELIYDAEKNKNNEHEKVKHFLEAAIDNLEIKQLVVKNVLSGKPLSLFDQEIIRRVATTPCGQFNSYILASKETDRESKILCMCYLFLTKPKWNEQVFDCIKIIGGVDYCVLQAAFQFEILAREKDCFFVNEVINMGLSPDNKNNDIAKKIIATTPKEIIFQLIHQKDDQEKEDQGLKNYADIIWKLYQESLVVSSQNLKMS